MAAENPYVPPSPAAQGAPAPDTAGASRANFYRGAYLVFRLLALFSLVGLVEELLRVPASYLLAGAGSTGLTLATAATSILGLAARFFLLLWTLRRAPDTAPRGWGAPVGWAVAFGVSALGTSSLSALSTMVLGRMLRTEAFGQHIMTINMIGSAKWALHTGLLVVGLLIAFSRWRAAARVS